MPKGQWTPPEAGEDAPKEVKDILKKVYSSCRDEHPEENEAVKTKCAKMAWGAVENAGWRKNSEGKWIKNKTSMMTEKWIEILKAGDYPQGNITREMLEQIAENYDPDFLQASLFPKHRQFNDKGELLNGDMKALGWIKAVRVNDNALQILPENEDDFKKAFDGFRYASAEIQYENKDGKKIPYLGGLVPTNFPASKIPQIKFNGEVGLRIYTKQIKINSKEEIIMNKEQFIQLCKTLGMKEDSTPEEVITKLTEMNNKLKEKDELKDIASTFERVIKLIKVGKEEDDDDDDDEANNAIKKLTDTVNSVLTKFDAQDIREAEQVFDYAVKERKVLPSQKEDLVGTKEKPGTFYKNAPGLKAFVDKLPALKLSATITIPKNEKTGVPLTFSELVKDPVAYQRMQRENPELFKELKNKRFEPVGKGDK